MMVPLWKMTKKILSLHTHALIILKKGLSRNFLWTAKSAVTTRLKVSSSLYSLKTKASVLRFCSQPLKTVNQCTCLYHIKIINKSPCSIKLCKTKKNWIHRKKKLYRWFWSFALWLVWSRKGSKTVPASCLGSWPVPLHMLRKGIILSWGAHTIPEN